MYAFFDFRLVFGFKMWYSVAPCGLPRRARSIKASSLRQRPAFESTPLSFGCISLSPHPTSLSNPHYICQNES